MHCKDCNEELTAYLDGELPDDRRRAVEEHLADCPDCRGELEALKKLQEDLAMIRFKEPTEAELHRYWCNVYNRLERGAAWCALSLGAIVLLCYGAFRLIEDFVRNPGVALALKVGVIAVIFGGLALLVSVLRERLALRKADKYSREIDK